MQAMMLFKPQHIENKPLVLTEAKDPLPAAGQVRLRVKVCGVCHTDLHTVEGELYLRQLPIIPGHQIVGEVDAVGPGATRFRPGERIGVGWLGWTCGECEFCRRGEENLCPQARFTGLDLNGGYAQYVLIDERYAYPIPTEFKDVEAAPLLCAGIIGFRSLRLSGIQPGQRLGLYGFGASAHIVIQVARHWGCEVYVFSRGQEHRQLAEELGAAWTGQVEDRPPVFLDAAIIFAPAGWVVPLALSHLRPGGTLAINAVYMSPIPEFSYKLIYGERLLRSVANFTRQDAEDFLRLAAAIPVRTRVETYPLREANEALQRLKRGEIRGSAVLELG
ncbi:MAG: zinc-dependent alcohol dehydrogenase family protein [Candidatus Aminicenantales bacterium]